MFLSAIQSYVVAIIIVLIVLQYAFALFCLLKLAYFDVSRRDYILWNLFILIGVFVGGAVFLVYYFKHPELRIPKTPTETIVDAPAEDGDAAKDGDGSSEQSVSEKEGENAEQSEAAPEQTDEKTE